MTEFDVPDDWSSMIKFVVIDDKMSFDVVLPPGVHRGLKVSARLLAVARLVMGKHS